MRGSEKKKKRADRMLQRNRRKHQVLNRKKKEKPRYLIVGKMKGEARRGKWARGGGVGGKNSSVGEKGL